MNADRNVLLETAVYAGELMLASGAETYRVEDTIRRILELGDGEIINVSVFMTAILASIEKQGEKAKVLIRRTGNVTNNLGTIAEVNNISRELCAGAITLEEARTALKAAEKIENPRSVKRVCYVITSVAFCLLLGGRLGECAVAALNGLILLAGVELNRRLRVKKFVMNMLVTFLMAVCCMAVKTFVLPEINVEAVIAAAIMALLPGLAITNAIRDTLNGDYISGGARAIEAFVTAAAIGIGVGAGMAFASTVLGGMAA